MAFLTKDASGVNFIANRQMQNWDGHVIGGPRDAFWKSGAGGFALIIVPSLDLVIYKMGGNNGQYDPTLTDVPQPKPSHARDDWKPIQGTPFIEGSVRKIMEFVACWRWFVRR